MSTDVSLPPLPGELRHTHVMATEHAVELIRAFARAAVLADRQARGEPYLHVYEYHSAMGLHREFYPREWNGMQPDRTVPLYAAPQPVEQRVPLTEEQVVKMLLDLTPQAQAGGPSAVFELIVRAVEAHHGIGDKA